MSVQVQEGTGGAVSTVGFREVGLTEAEFTDICARLGRHPNPIELRCLGVMWSEHCAYKHSRNVLRRLPTRGERVLQGPGENAGVVDIGAGWAVVWKMESHNHPSAVDPYNGAATGIGGIIRDVLAMGARPIALLDSLRFGPLGDVRARRLLGGVVAGVAGYGNSVGVPTVGGELATDETYRDNPLVNVACLGIIRSDAVARGRAADTGAVLLYAGARTGRDGIGGAAFASEELDAGSEREDRAAVQIGDPFAGKCLVEATLEALATGAVLGLQDMGAGGLTCAAAEMASRGGRGVILQLEDVPLRERGMAAHEILLSESQERMLLVTDPADAEEVGKIFRRWGLSAAVVGTVTDGSRFVARHDGVTVADVPVSVLTEVPIRNIVGFPPAPEADTEQNSLRSELDPAAILLRLLATPEVASKEPIFEQYDHTVQVRTVQRPGRGAAVLRLTEAPPTGLALTSDGNGRWCTVDPYGGAAASVLEAAANLACVGAEPLAVTDCLNFASPETPQVFLTFEQGVQGIADACSVLGVPVVGGNVSFYNEGPRGSIIPTPVVAMVGLIPDVEVHLPIAEAGNILMLLGSSEAARLSGSLYAREIAAQPRRGHFPRPDIDLAARTIECVREMVRHQFVSFATDVSDGGLAVALAESCLLIDIGARVEFSPGGTLESVLFGEGGTRFVCAVPVGSLDNLREIAGAHNVPLTVVGALGGTTLQVLSDERELLALDLEILREAWTSLERVI